MSFSLPKARTAAELSERSEGVHVCAYNQEVVDHSEVVIIAVRRQAGVRGQLGVGCRVDLGKSGGHVRSAAGAQQHSPARIHSELGAEAVPFRLSRPSGVQGGVVHGYGQHRFGQGPGRCHRGAARVWWLVELGATAWACPCPGICGAARFRPGGFAVSTRHGEGRGWSSG